MSHSPQVRCLLLMRPCAADTLARCSSCHHPAADYAALRAGRTTAVLPTSIMSMLVPLEGNADSLFDNYQPLAAIRSTLYQPIPDTDSKQ